MMRSPVPLSDWASAAEAHNAAVPAGSLQKCGSSGGALLLLMQLLL
jgi:hypothetical protein